MAASADSSTPDLRALVTGASSGIGLAFARALHRRGERLILVARRAERMHSLVGELGGAENVLVLPLDLADPQAPGRLEAEVRARGLSVDLLVNNAGRGDTGRFHERPLDSALAIVDLNTRALVELTRRFLPSMVARGRGRVLNVVSMSAFQPVPFLAVYAASKAFVLSFTEALATEIEGTGVRIQALCPGNIPTEFQQVAGTTGVPFSSTPSLSAERVAEVSLDALSGRQVTVIPGLGDRMTVAAQRLLPRAFVRRAAAALFRPSGPR
jgi:short-subunit dehydrogenase